ncbi:MAG TPA: hypothetical protein VMY88_01415 [Acidimicrobiales bacterium]|nr:hypothetical protein [Acidimicrobiales bacterium]
MRLKDQRAWRIVALTVLLVAPLLACGEPKTEEDRLLAAISRTDRLAYNFVYEDTRESLLDALSSTVTQTGELPEGAAPPAAPPGAAQVFSESVVQGVVEDDFRFKVQLSIADRPTMEKVVSDDTVAVRFLDPSSITRFVDKAVADQVDTETDREGISVPEALQSGRWVIDPEGAPQQLLGLSADRVQGIDPVLDALTTFSHVRAAVDKAQQVERFSKDSLDPAYRRSEDPFPAPDEDSGVIRYDLRRPQLPAVGSIGASGQPDLPSTEHFRKMAVYVNDKGQVIQVLERVEITGSQVAEFRKYFNAFLEDVFAEAPGGGAQLASILNAQEEVLKEEGNDALGAFLLSAWSVGSAQNGGDPVEVRTLRLDLQDLGKPNKVELPSEDIVTGDLAVLVGTGRKPAQAEGGAAAPPTTAAPASAPPAAPTPVSGQ